MDARKLWPMLTLVAVTACSAAHGAESSATVSDVVRGISLAPGVAAALSLGDEPVNTLSTLAADSDGTGVWTWVTSATQSRLVYAVPDRNAVSVPLPTGDEFRLASRPPALAVCSDGVWFGINRHLVHVEAGKVMSVIEVPATTPIPAVERYRPPQVKGLSGVEGVACAGSLVGVTLDDATQAFTFDPTTGRFDPIELPTGQEAVKVAGADDGTLAIGLQDSLTGAGPHQVLVRTAAGATQITKVDDSSQLTSDGSTFLAGGTTFTSSRVADVAKGSTTGPGASDPGAGTVVIGNIASGTARTVTATETGLRVINLATGTSHDVPLGVQQDCGYAPGMPPPDPDAPSSSPWKTPAPGPCAITSRLLAGSRSGDVVYAVTGGSADPQIVAVHIS